MRWRAQSTEGMYKYKDLQQRKKV
ncbi:uncharacterized protein METZ01_LOCUS325938 [marine metagenome]|uniref:Uncharacterized protein n=1 Tax=marine metagenome TaxID=408172 RepID=A0A382PI59_9ZZZZ